MISYLQGVILSKTGRELVLLTSGGVGYKVLATPSAEMAAVVGQEAKLECFLVVREDALDLFGFANARERELFKLFISVSGVGPKTAMHLFDLGSAEEISLAIGRGDVSYLTNVSGIGKKTAERIIVELQSRVKDFGGVAGAKGEAVGDALGEILDALVAMGYSTLEARETLKQLDVKGKSSEQLLREALRQMR